MEPIRMDLEGYPCPCPGTPHTLEWVELEPGTTIPMGMAAMACLQRFEGGGTDVFYGLLAPILLRFGIRAWSFSDEKRGRVSINPDSIATLLPFGEVGYEVANRCMGLYLEEIMRPLARRQSARLGFTQTGGTTSATPTSGPTPRISRSRSSRKSTAGPTSEGQGL